MPEASLEPSRKLPLIAIDGPAAAGKGTLAQSLATRLDLPYLDTGLLYRAIGKLMQDAGQDLDDPSAATGFAERLAPDDLRRTDLRGREAGELASRVVSHSSRRPRRPRGVSA